ncbi:MAG TPA: hypothetical protein VIU46_01900 [Gallionellaceae bacterium]
MQFYLSLKRIPELRHRNWKERRQILWQLGRRPYRSWRFWLTLAITSLVVLWALNMVLGMMLMDPTLTYTNQGYAGMVTLLALISLPAVLFCWHSYLKAMRPFLPWARSNPEGSWWAATLKGLAMDLQFALLFAAAVVSLDWAINQYDEAPDPRLAAILSWPESIPDENNGFIAAAGLQAAPGTPPFEAGKRWVAGVNDAIARHAHDYPKAPDGLKYVAYVLPPYVTKPEADRTGASAKFCETGKAECLKILRQEQKAVEAWLAANRELLARYLDLQKYLQWQYALKPGDLSTPFPPMNALIPAQSLMQASALQAIEKKQVGKGLGMLGDDIRFVRNMLGSKDMLIGKMVAANMLARDLALLAEIIRERPNEIKPYWAQIENMLEPLSASQVSVANAFRFEERWVISSMSQFTFNMATGTAVPSYLEAWADHHFKRNATSNLMAGFWDEMFRHTEVHDASYTPPVEKANIKALTGYSRLTGFMHNQAGKAVFLVAMPEYSYYPNRLFDLNALNSLVRVRLELARNNVSPLGVPAYLASADKSLQNPETGKPFEWDSERREVYFVPAMDWFSRRFPLGGRVPGRIGLAVPGAEKAK